jgi:transposase
MEKRALWSERVHAWRASGVSMNEFCRGKEYSASNLSYWGRRLASHSPALKSVRLARVLRSRPEASQGAATSKNPHCAAEPRPLLVEAGGLRVHVPGQEDGARLEALLVAVVRAVKAGAL